MKKYKMKAEKIKVIITDDKEKWRALYRETLSAFPVKIVAEAGDGKELLQVLTGTKADVVLLDLEMPVLDGSKTFDQIRKRYPETRVIVISFHYEGELIDNYCARGAKGYIPKDKLSPELLHQAITTVAEGGIFFYEKPPAAIKWGLRHKQIMPMIFDNVPNKKIALAVGISERAVEKQRRSLYQKTGADNAVEFFKYAFSRGLQYLSKLDGTGMEGK